MNSKRDLTLRYDCELSISWKVNTRISDGVDIVKKCIVFYIPTNTLNNCGCLHSELSNLIVHSTLFAWVDHIVRYWNQWWWVWDLEVSSVGTWALYHKVKSYHFKEPIHSSSYCDSVCQISRNKISRVKELEDWGIRIVVKWNHWLSYWVWDCISVI